MPNYARTSFFSGTPQAGLGTKWLCGLLLGVSVAAAVLGRFVGVGPDLLVFSVDAVAHGELWRLLTYAFIKPDPLSLLIRTLVLYLFGRLCEGSWGTRDFVRFFLLSSVGAALLAMPINYLANRLPLPFHDLGIADGPDAAIDAMMVALALNAPEARVLFGFVLPIQAKQLIYVLLGMDLLFGLMTGASAISITLGGMLMGYFLVTGHWRPRAAFAQIRNWVRRRRRRDRLYVVPPRQKKHWLN